MLPRGRKDASPVPVELREGAKLTKLPAACPQQKLPALAAWAKGHFFGSVPRLLGVTTSAGSPRRGLYQLFANVCLGGGARQVMSLLLLEGQGSPLEIPTDYLLRAAVDIDGDGADELVFQRTRDLVRVDDGRFVITEGPDAKVPLHVLFEGKFEQNEDCRYHVEPRPAQCTDVALELHRNEDDSVSITERLLSAPATELEKTSGEPVWKVIEEREVPLTQADGSAVKRTTAWDHPKRVSDMQDPEAWVTHQKD